MGGPYDKIITSRAIVSARPSSSCVGAARTTQLSPLPVDAWDFSTFLSDHLGFGACLATWREIPQAKDSKNLS